METRSKRQQQRQVRRAKTHQSTIHNSRVEKVRNISPANFSSTYSRDERLRNQEISLRNLLQASSYFDTQTLAFSDFSEMNTIPSASSGVHGQRNGPESSVSWDDSKMEDGYTVQYDDDDSGGCSILGAIRKRFYKRQQAYLHSKKISLRPDDTYRVLLLKNKGEFINIFQAGTVLIFTFILFLAWTIIIIQMMQYKYMTENEGEDLMNQNTK